MPPTSLIREVLDPGPPPVQGATGAFVVGRQALLVTFATNAPEFVGKVLSLDKPVVKIGRGPDSDIIVPEATVSGEHAQFHWQHGSWIVTDLGSTNGSYLDSKYERQEAAASADSPEAPLTLVKYSLRGPTRRHNCRSSIIAMLALRRAATRVVELSELASPLVRAVIAGRTGPLDFHVGMVGRLQDVRTIAAQIQGQVQGMLPDGFDFAAPELPTEPPDEPA